MQPARGVARRAAAGRGEAGRSVAGRGGGVAGRGGQGTRHLGRPCDVQFETSVLEGLMALNQDGCGRSL